MPIVDKNPTNTLFTEDGDDDDSDDDSDAEAYNYYYNAADEPSFTEPLLEATMAQFLILPYFKEHLGAMKARAPQVYYDLYTHSGVEFQRLADYTGV